MPAPKQDVRVTLIGCPDCSGVLSQLQDGDGPHIRFACSVGHAYSLYSLLQAKEEQLEQGFWSVVSLLEHVAMIDEVLLRHVEENRLPTPTDGLAARVRQVREQVVQIRKIIEDTTAPGLEPEGDESRIDSV